MHVEIDPVDLDTARAAVRNAVNVRNHHKRRTRKGDEQREKDIALALERLKDSMKPLRRAIAQFPYDVQTDAAEEKRGVVRALSADIQAQRRRLWKMQLHKKKES
jgi:hypothetical protein